MKFIHQDFLLQTRTTARLYHEYAEAEPILDYHCHLPPKDVAENRQFKDLFEGVDAGSVPGINTAALDVCWLLHYENLLWFAYPAAGSTTPDNLLVFNLLTKRAVHYDYGTAFRAAGVDRTNDRVLAADDSGYVWALETGTDDNGTAVAWQASTRTRSHSSR